MTKRPACVKGNEAFSKLFAKKSQDMLQVDPHIMNRKTLGVRYLYL